MSEKFVNPHGRLIGYARVSSRDQKITRQIDKMIEYGVPKDLIFEEKESGKNFNNRPVYKRILRMLRRGDVLVIIAIDRLGRNYQGIIDQWRIITQDIGCGIHVLDMPLLNTSGDPNDLLSKFVTDMMLQVLSFVADNERTEMLRRQKAGYEAAKKRGVKLGRPKVRVPYEFWNMYLCWKSKSFKVSELLEYAQEEWGIKQRTFYRRISELDSQYGNYSYEELCLMDVSEYKHTGFPYLTETKEAEEGIFKWYKNDPYKEREYRKKVEALRKQKEQEEIETDYAEIRQIIREKRQAEFAERFQIQQQDSGGKRRGKKPSISADDPINPTIIIK